MNWDPVEVRPVFIERLILWSLYYWAVVVAGFVLLIPEALVLLAVRGELSGPLGPTGRVLVVVAWALVAIPFVWLVHRFNARYVDRSTRRLTPETLSIGRHGQTEVGLDAVRHAYFAKRRVLGRPRYVSADQRRFDLLLLVLDDESLLAVDRPPHPGSDRFTQALVAALGPKLRENQPLPSYAQRYLRGSQRNRRHYPGR